MKQNIFLGFSSAFVALVLTASSAQAESGECQGLSKLGELVTVNYNTNPYSADSSDLLARIKIGESATVAYDLHKEGGALEGAATAKSLKDGKDLGPVTLRLSANKKLMTGSIGEEALKPMDCTFKNL